MLTTAANEFFGMSDPETMWPKNGGERLIFTESLVRTLFVRHGLSPGWQFQFDGMRSRYGCCFFGRHTISLSRHYVCASGTSMGMVLDTILHEIAHALAGHAAGHGPVWVAKAREIGCCGSRCAMRVEGMPGEKCLSCECGKVKLRCFRFSKRHRTMVCPHCHSCLSACREKASQHIKVIDLTGDSESE